MPNVPPTILAQFALSSAVLRPVEHFGFSGSQLWKVDRGPLPPLSLKRWPASHPPPARLPWIHGVLRRAHEAGLDFIPQSQSTRHGQTTCEADGSTWELMAWLPGEVEERDPPPRRRVEAAFRALARFHQVTADFATNHLVAPAFTVRYARWLELSQGGCTNIARRVATRSIPEIDDLARQWLATPQVDVHSDPLRLGEQLRAAAQLPLRLQPAIRDIWRDHVLFTGDEVTGFIDFGAMKIDTPLTDLARLIGSLAKNDSALRAAALGAYAKILPLESRDRELIELLDRTGRLIAGWNWLQWLYVEDRQFPSLVAVRERLSELLGALSTRSA